MKIAIVSDAIYPYNKGGKEKRIFEISTRLAKRGHDVHIYTMKWWTGPNIKRENNLTLHAISKLHKLYHADRRSIKEAIFFALSCFKLITEDFDIIDVDHMPHLILFPVKIVSILKNKKLVATWNEVWGTRYWVSYMGIAGVIASLVEKLSVKTPDAIIAVSSHTRNALVQKLKYSKKIIIIPNGIDFANIQKVKASKNNSDIIYAGRLLSHKNIELLLKALKLLTKSKPEIKCIIIGEGPEKGKIEKLTKQFNLEKNIRLLNFFEDHAEVYAHIKASKAFVLPSTREGFGIVILEANACGIPAVTVSHANNAASDLVINGINGYVADFEVSSLAKKISLSLDKKIDKSKIYRIARQYDWDKITVGVEKFYKSL